MLLAWCNDTLQYSTNINDRYYCGSMYLRSGLSLGSLFPSSKSSKPVQRHWIGTGLGAHPHRPPFDRPRLQRRGQYRSRPWVKSGDQMPIGFTSAFPLILLQKPDVEHLGKTIESGRLFSRIKVDYREPGANQSIFRAVKQRRAVALVFLKTDPTAIRLRREYYEGEICDGPP